jgi:phosphotransferase system IIB component
LDLNYRAPHAAIAPAESLSGVIEENKAITAENSFFYDTKAYTFLGGKTYTDPKNFKRIENDFNRLYLKVRFNNKFSEEDLNAQYGIRICIITSQLEVVEENIYANKVIEKMIENQPDAPIIDALDMFGYYSYFELNTFDFSLERMLGNLYIQGSS